MISNFRWQIEDQLAGMSRPRFGSCCSSGCGDAGFLKEKGITAIVSLVEMGDQEAVEKSGFKFLHFPLVDGSSPSLATARAIVETITKLLDDGETVAVHCTAGLGRTGTALALYLVHKGMSAQEAIDTVRRKEPLAIENRGQERAIADYEAFLKKMGRV